MMEWRNVTCSVPKMLLNVYSKCSVSLSLAYVEYKDYEVTELQHLGPTIIGVARIYDWGPGVLSAILMQHKLVLSACSTSIFLFLSLLHFLNFQIGILGPKNPLWLRPCLQLGLQPKNG